MFLVKYPSVSLLGRLYSEFLSLFCISVFLYFCISVFQTGNKYAEKGKELLAKIVFYRQSEDKQKLTPEA